MLPIFPEEMRITGQKSEVRGQKTQPAGTAAATEDENRSYRQWLQNWSTLSGRKPGVFVPEEL
jgi:hypothetical protein